MHRKISDVRKNVRAKVRNESRGVHQKIEDPIRGLHQTPRDFDSLFVVAVQNLRAGLSAHYQRELPRQVVAVLDSGVHTLRAGWRVNMSCVADKEAPAFAESVDVS